MKAKAPAFVFDDVSVSPDRQIGIHCHPQWELSYVLCGAGTRTVGDTTEAIVEGEIILVPPGISHGWKFDRDATDSSGNIANISVFFRTETLKRLSSAVPEFADVYKRMSTMDAAVRYTGEAYRRLSGLLLAMRGMSARMRLPSMMEVLSAIADADGCKSVGHSCLLSRVEQRLEAVRVYCRCNYRRGISLDEISREVGMNKSSFCTFMRNHSAMSFTEFVNGIRLEKAKEMLDDTDIAIASIAYDVGFANVTYFNRLFKKKYNCNPKTMRANNRGKS